RTILDHPVRSFALTVMPVNPRPNEPIHFVVWPSAGDELAGWGTFDIDFGDGRTESARTIADNTEIAHTYAAPGYYEATGRLTGAARDLVERTPVIVASARDDDSDPDVRNMSGLTSDVAAAPRTVRVSRE